MKLLKYWLAILIALLVVACGNDGVVPMNGGNGMSAITGSVTSNNVALNNVTVAIAGASSLSATTDLTGGYTSGTLPSGAYTVTPALAGYTFTPVNRIVTVTKGTQTNAPFTAVQGKYSLTGAISGDIKAGVSITMYDTNNIPVTSVISDANGMYYFPNVVGGTYNIIPSLSGYAFTQPNLSVTVNNANVTGVNFTSTVTTSGTGISNIVSGVISGASFANVDMTAYNSNGVSVMTATSDSNGWYSFTLNANGSFTIVPSLSGYTFTPTSTIVTVNKSNQTGVNFSSVAGAASAYSLAGAVTGDINAGVIVSVYNSSNVFQKSTTTDQNGFYSLTGLVSGSYLVIPNLTGYTFSPASNTINIAGSNINNNNYVSTKQWRTISGTITGAPYSTVNLVGPSTTLTTLSDSAGNYSFQVFLPGSYTITPSKSGYSYVQPSAIIGFTGTSITGVNFDSTFIPSIGNNAVHGSVTYSCSGATLTIPANVNTLQFTATGGDGGPSTNGSLQGGGGGGAAMAYDYTTGQWLYFIGGGGGGGNGIGGANQAGGAGGTFTTFAKAGRDSLGCGATIGVDGSTYQGGAGGQGGPFNFNNYGGVGGNGSGTGRGGNGAVFGGSSCAFFTLAQPTATLSQGCPADGAIAPGITAITGLGGDGGYASYSSGGGGGGGYGGGGGGAAGGHDGNGCEEGGGGGGGGNYVLPGAIISGNTAMFNIDFSNHIIGIMGSPGGYNVQNNGQCGTVTAIW